MKYAAKKDQIGIEIKYTNHCYGILLLGNEVYDPMGQCPKLSLAGNASID